MRFVKLTALGDGPTPAHVEAWINLELVDSIARCGDSTTIMLNRPTTQYVEGLVRVKETPEEIFAGRMVE